MSQGVEFENENANLQNNFRSRTVFGQPTTPGMIKTMLKLHVAKDEKTAGNLLRITAIVCVVASIAIGIYIARGSGAQGVRYNLPSEVVNALPLDAQEKLKNNGK